ncbi:MAG: hypothetical protein IKC23_06325, partial [Fibrobacter sp.]|nr:hypothetical protein [Fibrobacter sp.]
SFLYITPCTRKGGIERSLSAQAVRSFFCFKSRKLRQYVAVMNNKSDSATDRCCFALAMFLSKKFPKVS